MARLSLKELQALKDQEQKINSEKNKKAKPRFEQEVFPTKDGKGYEGSVSEVIFLDREFDPEKEDGSNGLIAVLEHPKILGKQVDEYGKPTTPKGFQGYNEVVVWESCAQGSGVGSCPICDGRLAKLNKVVYHKASDQITKNRSKLHIYMTVVELNPKKYNKETKKLEPIKKQNGSNYEMFKKLLPLDYSAKGSTARRIEEVLLEAYYEINKETGKPYNSIRGVKMLLKRGDDKMSHKIGEPKRYDPEGKKGLGLRYKRLTEDELNDLCGYTENKVNGETKRYSNSEPYDYEKVLPLKSEEDLCIKYGIPYTKPVGQGDNQNNILNNSNDDNDELDDKELNDIKDEDFDFPDDIDDDIPF